MLRLREREELHPETDKQGGDAEPWPAAGNLTANTPLTKKNSHHAMQGLLTLNPS